MSCNANRKCGSVDSFLGFFLSACHSTQWDICIIQEFDNFHRQIDTADLEKEIAPHAFYRNYGGVGCTAIAVVINARVKPFINELFWSNRGCSIILEQGRREVLHIISAHGYETARADETQCFVM